MRCCEPVADDESKQKFYFSPLAGYNRALPDGRYQSARALGLSGYVGDCALHLG